MDGGWLGAETEVEWVGREELVRMVIVRNSRASGKGRGVGGSAGRWFTPQGSCGCTMNAPLPLNVCFA